jgi:LPS-assembly lipoprotein
MSSPEPRGHTDDRRRPARRRSRDQRGTSETGLRSQAARALVALIVAGGIAGCGFHLRGDVDYAFSTLYVNAPASTPLAAELKRALEGSGTTLAETAAAAQAILDLSSIADDKQVLSLSGGGRVREYQLTKRATFALHDANGRDWLPAAEIVIRRTYSFNESEVLAREAQETRLLTEMQTDAVQQIMRRLQAAKKPG